MNAAQIHLMVVHGPIVGCFSALALLIAAAIARSDILFRAACWFLLGCAALAAVAYYSGPPAYELLKVHYTVSRNDVEQHALLGRVVFVGLLLLGIIVINALLPYFQGQKPPHWLKWLVLVSALVMCYASAWCAHLGGMIRHPELREPPMVIFPNSGE